MRLRKGKKMIERINVYNRQYLANYYDKLEQEEIREEQEELRRLHELHYGVKKNKDDDYDENEMYEYISKTQNQENKQNNVQPYRPNAARTKDKNIIEGFAGKVTGITPADILMIFGGVDPDEMGDAIRDGAKSGKGGDFGAVKDAWNKYCNKVNNILDKDGSFKAGLKALKEAFKALPNLGAAVWNNAMKYLGKGLSDVFGDKLGTVIGSAAATAGKFLKFMGEGVANAVTGLAKAIDSLFREGPAKAAEQFKQIGKKFAEIGKSALEKIKTFGKDVKEYIKHAGEHGKKMYNAVKTVAKEAYNRVSNALKAGSSIADKVFKHIGGKIVDGVTRVAVKAATGAARAVGKVANGVTYVTKRILSIFL